MRIVVLQTLLTLLELLLLILLLLLLTLVVKQGSLSSLLVADHLYSIDKTLRRGVTRPN